jgi:choline transport protein
MLMLRVTLSSSFSEHSTLLPPLVYSFDEVGVTVAFNSLVIGVIIFQYLSYSIPIILLLIRGRNTLARGPFFLGKIGLFCNWVTYFPRVMFGDKTHRASLLWTVFTTVFFCFPAVMPVEANNMNYISVIVVGYFLLAMGWWFFRGRKVSRGPQGGDDMFVDKSNQNGSSTGHPI